MKETIFSLSWRKLILISILVSTMFLAFDSSGVFTQKTYGNLSWKCPVGTHEDCVARGCVRSSNAPDSYWVCRYSGTACPPLEACEQ